MTREQPGFCQSVTRCPRRHRWGFSACEQGGPVTNPGGVVTVCLDAVENGGKFCTNIKDPGIGYTSVQAAVSQLLSLVSLARSVGFSLHETP